MTPQLAEKFVLMKSDLSRRLDEVSKTKCFTQEQKKFRRKNENGDCGATTENEDQEPMPVYNIVRATVLHSARIMKNILQNNVILFIVLVLSSSCMKYVLCAIEPEPDNNVFDSDDEFSKVAVSFRPHININITKKLPITNCILYLTFHL